MARFSFCAVAERWRTLRIEACGKRFPRLVLGGVEILVIRGLRGGGIRVFMGSAWVRDCPSVNRKPLLAIRR